MCAGGGPQYISLLSTKESVDMVTIDDLNAIEHQRWCRLRLEGGRDRVNALVLKAEAEIKLRYLGERGGIPQAFPNRSRRRRIPNRAYAAELGPPDQSHPVPFARARTARVVAVAERLIAAGDGEYPYPCRPPRRDGPP